MNPLDNEATPVPAEPTPVEAELDATPREVIEPEAPAPVFLQSDENEVEEYEEEEFAEEANEPAWTSAAPASVEAPVFYQSSPMYADEPASHFVEESTNWDYTHADDGGFYVTVIQDRNHKQRNVLLLGSTAFVLFTVVMAWGISLFSKALDVDAIGGETSLAYLIDDVPMQVEEEKQQKKDDDAGGGGGGGKNQPDPVNQGDLPNQTKNPQRPPDPNVPRFDFELKMPPPSTEGNKKFEQKFGQWGDPNSRFQGLSSGPGTGGGMGTGTGTGAGSGNGTGTGSGSGSGYGSGNGDGNGNGSGSGEGGTPPPSVAKISTPVKIISKPQAKYTDAGRTNNIQGSVRLKVTLLANGQVGSITPVTRLPHGLTEQAIAAARLLRFEPAKVNGQAVAKTITIDYSFTIY